MPKKTETNIKKALSDLNNSERSPGHRKGSFKIDAPFEEAMKKILKAKPEPKKRKAKSDDKRS